MGVGGHVAIEAPACFGDEGRFWGTKNGRNEFLVGKGKETDSPGASEWRLALPTP